MHMISDDFYKEISTINNTNINIKDTPDNDNNVCLISGENLNDSHISLDCNHKFNYFYIFNEIINQKNNKTKFSKILKINEMKCPYCRKFYHIKILKIVTKKYMALIILKNMP